MDLNKIEEIRKELRRTMVYLIMLAFPLVGMVYFGFMMILKFYNDFAIAMFWLCGLFYLWIEKCRGEFKKARKYGLEQKA